jgi:hypothetical protein
MAGKSDFLEGLILNLIFKGTTNAAWASAAGTATNLYVALHTADPGDAGSATTSETAYTGYARLAKNRSTDWTVSGTSPTQVAPAANLDFGQCTASPGGAITHFSIVDTASGAGNLLYVGTVTSNITMAVGVIPRLTTASTITED